MREHKHPFLAVDGIIYENSKILLVKRKVYPFIGYWILPGGHVEYGETVERALKREMKEELGVSVRIKQIVGIYSNPKRDPRHHTVSISYFCQKTKGKITLNGEASEFRYFSLNHLPKKIGFDHRKIIKDFQKLILSQ